MEKYVPLSKKSKKELKKFHAMQRNTWGGLNPVTRTVPNGKAYNRKKLKQTDFRDSRNHQNGYDPCCFCF
ncbi:MAG: hypothetical protein IKG39_08305 [Lachnospiraceae bacterium]|nr:hypothetical protein [Lachnospiraceae bacterium]